MIAHNYKKRQKPKGSILEIINQDTGLPLIKASVKVGNIIRLTVSNSSAITITGDPGVSSLVAADNLIATGKGWTITTT